MTKQVKILVDKKFLARLAIALAVIIVSRVIVNKVFWRLILMGTSEIAVWTLTAMQMGLQILGHALLLALIIKLWKPKEKKIVQKAIIAVLLIELTYAVLMSLLLVGVAGSVQDGLLLSLSRPWQLLAVLLKFGTASLGIKFFYKLDKRKSLTAGFFWMAAVLLFSEAIKLLTSIIN